MEGHLLLYAMASSFELMILEPHDVFTGFWMSDKPLVQQALATDLAEILLNIPNVQGSLDFLKGFWEAIVREWSGIDRLR